MTPATKDRLVYTAVLLALLAPSAAGAIDPWTPTDTAFEMAFASLVAVDVMQTRWGLQRPDRFHESNPLLGRHPGPTRLYLSALGRIALHVGVSAILPSSWRPFWRHISIAGELTAIGNNVFMCGGLRLDF